MCPHAFSVMVSVVTLCGKFIREFCGTSFKTYLVAVSEEFTVLLLLLDQIR